MTDRIDVLAVLDTVIDACVCGDHNCEGCLRLIDSRLAIAELIEADREFDAAHHDWEHVTAHDPQETSDEDWRRIADRFEAATMRRIAALANVGGA